MSATDDLEKYIGDQIFGTSQSSSVSLPTDIYLGLSKGDPGETGSTSNEVSGGSYARVKVVDNTNSSTDFQYDSTNQRWENSSAITFATASAEWASSTDKITHAFLIDSDSAGTVLWSAALGTQQAVASGQQPSFASGDLQFTIN